MEKNDKQVKPDQQINVNDQQEIRRWCQEFQCNEMRLKNAVRAVGPNAQAVRQYMTKKF